MRHPLGGALRRSQKTEQRIAQALDRPQLAGDRNLYDRDVAVGDAE